jgi:DNA primase
MDRGLKPVLISEGEIDALSLVAKGFPNVVSLPDGSESVKTADVDLLWSSAFNVWLLALDADEAGDRAYKLLRSRAEAAGVDAVRVFWRKLVGEEIVTYKDANEALLAGFTQGDFVQSLNVATEPRYGAPIPWDLAA